jgi:ABC-type Co2+ transport system permease subunit
MNTYLLAVLAILVILVGMKRVEGMKEEEKKKKITALKKFI